MIPPTRAVIHPPMTNARNDAKTAYARAPRPIPLNVVIRPAAPALDAPIAVPMTPKSATATMAASAPTSTGVQNTGHAAQRFAPTAVALSRIK
ncbi:MAG: hypothetical protein E6I28_05145 [Chloroflexi bacterium]|nr:MAG: hypothetical protein E6I28_05145 [Chloroflexota bacterium]